MQNGIYENCIADRERERERDRDRERDRERERVIFWFLFQENCPYSST